MSRINDRIYAAFLNYVWLTMVIEIAESNRLIKLCSLGDNINISIAAIFFVSFRSISFYHRRTKVCSYEAIKDGDKTNRAKCSKILDLGFSSGVRFVFENWNFRNGEKNKFKKKFFASSSGFLYRG